jgi:hypothetical protein
MPLKQLLKLLETTADDASLNTRRPRREDATAVAPPLAEPEYLRF